MQSISMGHCDGRESVYNAYATEKGTHEMYGAARGLKGTVFPSNQRRAPHHCTMNGIRTFCSQDAHAFNKERETTELSGKSPRTRTTSYFLASWIWLGLVGFFFITIIKKKGKFPPSVAAEPTETRFATGH